MEGLLLTAIFLPFLGCIAVAIAGQWLKEKSGWFGLVFPVVSTVCILTVAFQVQEAGGSVVYEVPWIPSLDVNLSFLVDGLSIFFGLVVSGMGILIFFYGQQYLDSHYREHGRFYAYLSLFMGAMLGTVFANNLMLLFVFWELTGIASFLLIGFLYEKDESRRGARMALLITAGTGLCMLVGVVLTGLETGTFALNELLSEPIPESAGWATPAVLLLMLGAFGKSAQFPFHFWLPNAMAAPTPVSAYLHSATMVKLGVFLAARLFPAFHEVALWLPLLVGIGFGTMVLASVLATLSNDLKAILAYSTVTQLGFLIGMYGLAGQGYVSCDYVQIANHVFYKGCLFMVAGIIDHCTGTRDIRQLGGLWRRMPLIGFAALITTASMAGIPGTFGFVSKELMLKDGFSALGAAGPWAVYALVCMIVASVFKVIFSARLFFHAFMGSMPERIEAAYHKPGLLIQLPPLLLASAAVVFGLVPGLLDGVVDSLRVAGLQSAEPVHLAVWHGLNKEFLTSMAIIGLGVAGYLAANATRWRWAEIPAFLRWDLAFDRGHDGFVVLCKKVTTWTGADSPASYLLRTAGVMFAGLIAVIWGSLASGTRLPEFPPIDTTGLRLFVCAAIAISSIGVVVLRKWTAQLISLSASGFFISFLYIVYRAPDLALTQILIETATLVLILFMLSRFPNSATRGDKQDRPRWPVQCINIVVSLAVGGVMMFATLIVLADPAEKPIGQWFLANTKPLAEGNNAVNTILVDFRGFDTLGEITVLLIAMLGCLGLLMRVRRKPQERLRGQLGTPMFRIYHEKGRGR